MCQARWGLCGCLKFMTHVTIVASPDAPAGADFLWPDEDACAHMAAALASGLAPLLSGSGSVFIALQGTLGAGKTTFTRHLLRAMGVQGRIKSPSYAVVESHEAGPVNVHHFDFYRFNDPQEWEDAGFRDLFAAPGLKLVEWPDKAAGLLPPPDLTLHLQPLDEARRAVRWQAGSELGQRALAPLLGQGQGQGLGLAANHASPAHATPGAEAHA